MPKTGKLVKDNVTANKGNTGWHLALERAKSALYKNRLLRSRLTAAIRLFEENIRNNEPWPKKLKGYWADSEVIGQKRVVRQSHSSWEFADLGASDS